LRPQLPANIFLEKSAGSDMRWWPMCNNGFQQSFYLFSVRTDRVIYRVSQEERSIYFKFIVSVILSKKLYTYMCPIPNSFRDRVISLYSSTIVDKKEILHTVSNTGIYCSSEKVGTVYLA
jgi:hypothetical protein